MRNLIIRFGTCKVRRLNRALVFCLIVVYLFYKIYFIDTGPTLEAVVITEASLSWHVGMCLFLHS